MDGRGKKAMDKKSLTEQDIRTKFITPAILSSGWNNHDQLREEVFFTDGRIIVRKNKAKRAERKKADYILYYKPNLPIAVVEAKDNNHSVGDGLQQAINYAEILDIPFVYTSNGDAFIELDRTVEDGDMQKEISLDSFPTPEELWHRYKEYKGIDKPQKEEIITSEYHYDLDSFEPRYYQMIAINRTVEAIARGQDRILLTCATGTGKTYIAFQIIYRLWKSKAKKRILYLADRNILVDQTMMEDFKPFGDKMTKIKNRTVDKSYEIYLALYQGISGEDDFKNIYKNFSSGFFDLIVVDECHRGSAKEDSAWREILNYFSSATQIGMTATPKETKEISNIEYFGEPIYTYSLKQGIEDGFLAPYKVVRVSLDKDLEGWRPTKGKLDKYGNEIEDREYNIKDYDRNLVLEKRTQLVAKRVSDFLKNNKDRFAKSIFFCVDTDHALRMYQALMNENSDLCSQNSKYVMRITGNDPEGKKELDNFITPSEKYPVLVTTSKLLTTGVNTKTVKYIILDCNINSMTEFKQIIGRGTRIREDYNKMFFTIIDFRNATRLFADADFDGEPVVIKTTQGDIPTDEDEPDFSENDFPNDENEGSATDISIDDNDTSHPPKYYVNDVSVKVINERVLYYGPDGKLITESLVDYSKKEIRKKYNTLDAFLQTWDKAEQKKAVIEELRNAGIFIDELQDEVSKDMDIFDLICHVAFDAPALTRKERANNVMKKNYFTKYGEKARQVLVALLDKYASEGIENLEDITVLKLPEFQQYGSLKEIINAFGGKKQYQEAVEELAKELYAA